MSAYSDDLRLEVAETLADVQAELITDGLIFREHEVKLATVTTTGADLDAGIPGTQMVSYKLLTPRPDVKFTQVYRWKDGVSTVIGDAKLTISRQSCTEAELKAAAWIEVGSVRHSLVEGEIRQTSMFWAIVVKREAQ